MIQFQKLVYKNFLSTGNNPITIELNKSKSTLVVGTNGSGKSTILDAISFALFGKAHRNVTKPGLVNSVNGKGCKVSIEFETAGHDFKVVRGIHPNFFEVWQNGKMLDQQTNVRDYQKFLEQNILKLNHKSFHQIVVLGSSSFIPFMQLRAHDRRQVIEDLLDINIFSKMKNVLKVRSSQTRESYKSYKISADAQKDKIEYQKKHINQLEQINEDANKSFSDDIALVQTKIDSLKEQLDACPPQSGIEYKLKTMKKVKDDLISDKGRCQHEMKSLEDRHKFFETSVACPICSQAISEDLKKSMESDIMASGLGTMNELSHTKAKLKSAEDALESARIKLAEVANINSQMSTLNSSMAGLVNKKVKEVDMKRPLQDLVDLTYKLGDLQELRDEANQDLLYNDIASEMLKDTGIRTKVIKEYLPVMNTLINQYLQILEFFVAFHLDENFEETIKSRHRDAFVYDNFSEGEKMRIDLSLLFAWRQIAKMKNSTNTNLLILDETFDSSLDDDGVDSLLKILLTLENGTNTFIISHKPDLLENKLKAKIQFKKVNNFSTIEYS